MIYGSNIFVLQMKAFPRITRSHSDEPILLEFLMLFSYQLVRVAGESGIDSQEDWSSRPWPLAVSGGPCVHQRQDEPLLDTNPASPALSIGYMNAQGFPNAIFRMH